MIPGGLSYFKGKRILLLQGPLGPFFCRLSKDFCRSGGLVWKVNFNGGDWLFYPSGGIAFRGTLDEWPRFLEELLNQHGIDTIMLYGDCYPIHRLAREVAQRRKVHLWVFEEGYVRPDYVTFEYAGVNGKPKVSVYDLEANGMDSAAPPPSWQVQYAYGLSVIWACLYYLFACIGKPFFPHYRHHRPLSLAEAGPWVRGTWRKFFFGIKEKGVLQKLTGPLSKRFYLVPLQVHNDSQVSAHSDFDSVESFIRKVLDSFANHAPSDYFLVLKHHPMDRAYRDYGQLIQKVSGEHGLNQRVIYVHDLHLPSLLKHALGTVVINSTVGFSSLFHGTPVKVCGRAVYDLEGLTFQGPLEEFWKNAHHIGVDRTLFQRFKNHLIETTQLNGSFYSRLPTSGCSSGMIWQYEMDGDARHNC